MDCHGGADRTAGTAGTTGTAGTAVSSGMAMPHCRLQAATRPQGLPSPLPGPQPRPERALHACAPLAPCNPHTGATSALQKAQPGCGCAWPWPGSLRCALATGCPGVCRPGHAHGPAQLFTACPDPCKRAGAGSCPGRGLRTLWVRVCGLWVCAPRPLLPRCIFLASGCLRLCFRCGHCNGRFRI